MILEVKNGFTNNMVFLVNGFTNNMVFLVGSAMGDIFYDRRI